MRIALAQIALEMGNVTENRRAIFGALQAAARGGADLVVFPECSLAGWLASNAAAAAQPVSGPFLSALRRAAVKLRLHIAVGFEERAGGAIYNSALLISNRGDRLLRHRKIHELELAHSLYSRGKSLSVASLGNTGCALAICADNWTPDLGRALISMGARLILSPCAWAVEPGREARNLRWIQARYRALLKNSEAFVVAVNCVGAVTEGPWRGKIFQGDSLVAGPGGKILFQGPRRQPGVFFFDLTP